MLTCKEKLRKKQVVMLLDTCKKTNWNIIGLINFKQNEFWDLKR